MGAHIYYYSSVTEECTRYQEDLSRYLEGTKSSGGLKVSSKNCKKVGREFQESDKRVSKRKRVAGLIRWLQQDYIRYGKGLSKTGVAR
jgi:hypothetical protein